MTTLTTNRSLTTALRMLCCAGAFMTCSAWATVVTWQLTGTTPGHTNVVQASDNSAGTDVPNQLSFRNAPENGTSAEIGSIKAAALSDKLQARDTDFQQQAPSTISNAHSQSATQPSAAFNEQFVSVSNYQFASTASRSTGATAASGDGNVVPVPEMSAFFPIIGLIVAVSCTRILRRRRAAQLSAARILV